MTPSERERRAAASDRAAARRRTDRPSSRRSTADPVGGRAVVRALARGMQLRDSTTDPGRLHFTGYASVTGIGYDMWDFFGPYSELVAPGAFGETLARSDLDVPLVLDHDTMRRIARTTNGSLTLREDGQGLRVDAPSLDPQDQDVAWLVPKMRSALIDEMSFAFRITSGTWSPDYTEYRINAVDLHRGDVAIVGYGANPHTAGATLDERSARTRLAALRALAGQRPPHEASLRALLR